MYKESTPHSESTSPTFVFNPSQQPTNTPPKQSSHTASVPQTPNNGRESTTPTKVFKR